MAAVLEAGALGRSNLVALDHFFNRGQTFAPRLAAHRRAGGAPGVRRDENLYCAAPAKSAAPRSISQRPKLPRGLALLADQPCGGLSAETKRTLKALFQF